MLQHQHNKQKHNNKPIFNQNRHISKQFNFNNNNIYNKTKETQQQQQQLERLQSQIDTFV
jgi:hypothetical protein